MKDELSFFRLYFSVWIHPRKVIQAVLKKEPNYFVWPIVLVNGMFLVSSPIFYVLLIRVMTLPVVFLTESILTIGFSIIFFLLVTFSIFWLGKLMGGKGTFSEVKTAYAWCYPILFFLGLVSSIEEIPNWIRILGGETDFAALVTAQKMGWQIFLMGLVYLLGFWSMIIAIINVAEVHKFSMWKSIALFIVLLVSVIVIEIIVVVILFKLGIFHPQ